VALEAFVRMYRQQIAEQSDFNVGGWLHRVGTNLGLNAIRDRRRRQQYEESAGKLDWLEHSASEPVDLVAAAEERSKVREILGEMNQKQAQVLVLRYTGRSYQEIAKVLEVSITSVGPLLHRAELEFERRFRSTEAKGG
jgi:RNA polymerase sigma factor (sigma-70 family)